MLTEQRCKYCNKLLFGGMVIEIEIQCPRCKRPNNMRAFEHPVQLTGVKNEIKTKP